MGNQADSKILTFLYASITDIQSTIRVIDTKVAVVLGVLVFPFTNLGKIYLNFAKLIQVIECGWGQWALWFLIGLLCLSWIFAFTAAIRVIMAIHNPAFHVLSSQQPAGLFHSGGLYRTKLIDVFTTRKLKSNYALEDYIQKFSEGDEQIKEELVFEHMKLVYIRDIKLIRLRWAYLLTFSWLFFGFISRMLYLFHCSK